MEESWLLQEKDYFLLTVAGERAVNIRRITRVGIEFVTKQRHSLRTGPPGGKLACDSIAKLVRLVFFEARLRVTGIAKIVALSDICHRLVIKPGNRGACEIEKRVHRFMHYQRVEVARFAAS